MNDSIFNESISYQELLELQEKLYFETELLRAAILKEYDEHLPSFAMIGTYRRLIGDNESTLRHIDRMLTRAERKRAFRRWLWRLDTKLTGFFKRLF